jgi:hypothetical protein
MAYVLVGGTAAGTVLILVFLPALYSIWYRVKRTPADRKAEIAVPTIEPKARNAQVAG